MTKANVPPNVTPNVTPNVSDIHTRYGHYNVFTVVLTTVKKLSNINSYDNKPITTLFVYCFLFQIR